MGNTACTESSLSPSSKHLRIWAGEPFAQKKTPTKRIFAMKMDISSTWPHRDSSYGLVGYPHRHFENAEWNSLAMEHCLRAFPTSRFICLVRIESVIKVRFDQRSSQMQREYTRCSPSPNTWFSGRWRGESSRSRLRDKMEEKERCPHRKYFYRLVDSPHQQFENAE